MGKDPKKIGVKCADWRGWLMGDSGSKKAGETVGSVLGFVVKVAIGTIVAVAIARAMGVAI